MPTNQENNITLNRPSGLYNTTNTAWKFSDLDVCPQLSDAVRVLSFIFENAKGFVKLGHYKKLLYYPAEVCRDPAKIAAIFGSRKLKRNNLVYSVCTYRKAGDGSQKNVQAVYALVIDVDYKNSVQSDIADLPAEAAAERFWFAFVENKIIPIPSFLEIGRNFKLIYVLSEPFIMVKAAKKRESCFTFLKRIVQVISETIQNAGFGDWGVDTQYKVSGFLRLPESFNVKWKVNKLVTADDFKHGTYIPVSNDEVSIFKYSSWQKWDITELAENVLPDLPDWYDRYKERKTTKSKSNQKIQKLYTNSLFKQRLEDLETLQSFGWDTGYREFMVYLYRLTAYQGGMTIDESIDAALRFNSKFQTPLHKHTVKSQCKPSDYTHKFKNITIREKLGLGENDYPFLFTGSGESRSERYQRSKEQKIQSGTLITKKQQLENTYAQIIELQNQGLKRKEIELQLNIPHSTMTRYIKEINNRKKESSNDEE